MLSQYMINPKFHSVDYIETSQTSGLRYFPCWINHDTQEIDLPVASFKCREFLNDWLFHVHARAEGGIYRLELDSDTYRFNPWVGDEYLLVYSTLALEHIYILEIADAVVDLSHVTTEVGVEKGGLIPIPEWARRSPLGMSIWSLALRGDIESCGKKPKHLGVIPEPFEESPNDGIMRQLSGVSQKDCVAALSTTHTNHLWEIDDTVEVRIGLTTHESFSVVNCTNGPTDDCLESAYRMTQRQIESLYDLEEEWDDDYYDPEENFVFLEGVVHQKRMLYSLNYTLQTGERVDPREMIDPEECD